MYDVNEKRPYEEEVTPTEDLLVQFPALRGKKAWRIGRDLKGKILVRFQGKMNRESYHPSFFT